MNLTAIFVAVPPEVTPPNDTPGNRRQDLTFDPLHPRSDPRMHTTAGLALLALLAALAPGLACAAELALLKAEHAADGAPRQLAAPDGRPAPVMRRVVEGALHDGLQAEARDGFTATLLALDEQARTVAGQPASAPTWLLLSDEDGGFARTGFWLQTDDELRYHDEPYVDLVVSEDDVASGMFEEIFAHELGHVMLRRLVPGLAPGWSRTPHAALAITDRTTAFDEGWAIHFQGLVRRRTRNERLQRIDHGLEDKPFLGSWASNIDRNARIDGMRRNVFVQRQLPLPEVADPVRARAHSTLFDSARLKTGDQMMASEGVVATVFYRWLGAGDAVTQAQRYRRVFESLHALDAADLDASTPVLVRLVQRHAADRPEDAPGAVRTLVETTYGATIDRRAAEAWETIARPGRLGEMRGFVGGLKDARAALADSVSAATADPARLDDALSPPLWLATGTGAEAVVLDANTAEATELAALPGIAPDLAARLVAERDARGGFASLQALGGRLSLDEPSHADLTRLHAAAVALGPVVRE